MGTTNSKPPGPIIRFRQSKTEVRSYLLLSPPVGACLCCVFYQPLQTQQVCKTKSAYFNFFSSHNVQGRISSRVFFLNLRCSRGCENPKSKCDINGDNLRIWSLKMSPTGSPVVTLSTKTSNLTQFRDFFSKNMSLSPDFGASVAFRRFFTKCFLLSTCGDAQSNFHLVPHFEECSLPALSNKRVLIGSDPEHNNLDGV